MNDPLVVEVAKLLQRAGNAEPFRDVVVIEGLVVGETTLVDGRVEIDLMLEAIVEGIAVGGQLSAAAVAPCRRCLNEVLLDLTLEVIEVFETESEPGDTYPIDRDKTIDLRPMVREAILLALPQLLLCAQDCAGPDPERFPTSGEMGDGASEETNSSSDPRWAALDQLDFD
ncbi:MAG: DUF177 domain-containing protein [Acidobacteria bacterium]|nr:DUF177 domain-containing protein [Acidobacteriota bacterium]